MVRVISILLIEQLRYFFRKEQLWLRLLLLFFLVLAFGVYSVGLGFALEPLSKDLEKDPNEVLLIAFGILSAVILMTQFFPTVKTKNTWIPKVYPVSLFVRFTTEVIIDFLSGPTLGAIIFMTIPFFISSAFELGTYVNICLHLVSLQLLLRAFHTFFQDHLNWKKSTLHAGIGALLVGICINVFSSYALANYWWLAAVGFYLIKVGAYFIEGAILERKSSQTSLSTRSYNSWRLSWSLAWNTKTVRTPLAIGLLMKLLFGVGFFAGVFNDDDAQSFMKLYLVFFLLSPLQLFTYVFNNLWGYMSSVWLTVDKINPSYSILFRVYLSIISVPLLIDICFSAILLIFIDTDLLFVAGLYFGSLVLNLFGGMLWSIYFPKPVKQAMKMGGSNTAIISNLAAMSITFALFALRVSPWFYLIIPLFMIGSWIIHRILLEDYSNKRHMIYNKIMK